MSDFSCGLYFVLPRYLGISKGFGTVGLRVLSYPLVNMATLERGILLCVSHRPDGGFPCISSGVEKITWLSAAHERRSCRDFPRSVTASSCCPSSEAWYPENFRPNKKLNQPSCWPWRMCMLAPRRCSDLFADDACCLLSCADGGWAW